MAFIRERRKIILIFSSQGSSTQTKSWLCNMEVSLGKTAIDLVVTIQIIQHDQQGSRPTESSDC